MSAVTQWFVEGERPALVGPYEHAVSIRDDQILGGLFQYWNGEFFGALSSTPEEAARPENVMRKSRFQNVAWRGLAEKPA